MREVLKTEDGMVLLIASPGELAVMQAAARIALGMQGAHGDAEGAGKVFSDVRKPDPAPTPKVSEVRKSAGWSRARATECKRCHAPRATTPWPAGGALCKACDRERARSRMAKRAKTQGNGKTKKEAHGDAENAAGTGEHKDAKGAKGEGRNCAVCGGSMAGKDPRAKVCSGKCRAENLRRLKQSWWARTHKTTEAKGPHGVERVRAAVHRIQENDDRPHADGRVLPMIGNEP